MDDARPRPLLAQRRGRLGVRVAHVGDHGEARGPGERHEAAIGDELRLPGRVLVVVVEPRFPYTDHPRPPGQVRKLGPVLFAHAGDVVRVNAHRREDVRFRRRQRNRLPGSVEAPSDPYADEGLDPRRPRPGEHFGPILAVVLGIQVTVRINHELNVCGELPITRKSGV